MSSSWASPLRREAAKQQSNPAVPRYLRLAAMLWRSMPMLLRLPGHLVLGALLFIVVFGVAPVEIRTPSVDPLIAPTEMPRGRGEVMQGPQTTPKTRFLESSTIPFTVRALRDTLPMGEPERSVRTSVVDYTVRSGDTLLEIAERFGLEGPSLLWANDRLADNPDFLHIGQVLHILPVDGAYHTVANRDTVESIAAYYRVDPETIASYSGNHIAVPQALEPGQKLIIPGGIKPYVPRRVFAYQAAAPENAKKGTGGFAWPMSGSISQRYWEGHQAIDIASAKGTEIVAADAGYVAQIQASNTGYGRVIIIDHGNGYQSLYAHLNIILVEAGQSVNKGQLIGKCGSTGNSTGPHLHFEVIKSAVRRNPLGFLP